MGNRGKHKLRQSVGLEDWAADRLWARLLENEKAYLLIYPTFDSKAACLRWLLDHGLPCFVNPRHVRLKKWTDSLVRQRNKSPYFRQLEWMRAEYILKHDEIISLWKKEKELLMWAKVGNVVQDGDVPKKDELPTLKKMGGRVNLPEQPEALDIDFLEVVGRR